MANARSAVSNVLDTVVSTSNAVCDTVNMLGKSAKYGSAWMDAVLVKQSITLKVDTEIFRLTHVETKAQELAEIRHGIEQWSDTNPNFKALYETALGQLRQALEPVK